MRAAQYTGPGDVRIVDIPAPEPPGEGMVTLKMLMGSVCGTDVSQFRRATMVPLFTPHPISRHSGPTVLGHEVVGVVVAKGPGPGVDLEIGQRVVPSSGWSCGVCRECRAGRTNICEGYYLLGVHAHGGFSEFATYPAAMCAVVPADCTTEAAAMAQPCAVALHAIARGGIRSGQTVALFGVGGIGSLLLALLRAQWGDLSIIAIDIDERRMETARQLGATHIINGQACDPVQAVHALSMGRGCDIVCEATGVPAVIKQALDSVRRGGRLLQIGIPHYPVSFATYLKLVTEEKEIIGSNGLCMDDLEMALLLLSTTDLAERIGYQVLDLDELVEHALLPLLNHDAGKKCLIRLS